MCLFDLAQIASISARLDAQLSAMTANNARVDSLLNSTNTLLNAQLTTQQASINNALNIVLTVQSSFLQVQQSVTQNNKTVRFLQLVCLCN